MMARLNELRDQARLNFERLTEREQLLVVGAAAALVLTLLVFTGWQVSGAIAVQRRRVHLKTEQLQQIQALRGAYLARQAERAQRMQTLGANSVRLVSLVEEAARQAGVEIGQLRPEDGEPGSDQVVESRLDLRAAGLSMDRLQDFLNRIESSAGVVVVRRLKVTRPYRKDTAEVELTVTTYRLRA